MSFAAVGPRTGNRKDRADNGSISDKVVKRRTDLLNLDTASTVPYVAVDAELVSSDTSGQYKTIVESEKYKKLLGQSTAGAPQQTLAGSVAAGAYSIPAAGSSSAGASGPSQAKIDEEVKAARETTIKEEQKVLNWLLAKNPNGRYVLSLLSVCARIMRSDAVADSNQASDPDRRPRTEHYPRHRSASYELPRHQPATHPR